MFSHAQIEKVLESVGTDFPRLVKELLNLGVLSFEHIVPTGTVTFYGTSTHRITIHRKQKIIEVHKTPSSEKLKEALTFLKSGKSDLPTFCMDAAEAGVEKWLCDLINMKVTYFDKRNKTIMIENIPLVNP